MPRRFCLEGSMPLWKARSVFAAESATRGPKASKYKHNNVRSWRRRHAVLGQRRVQGPVLEGPEVRREVGKPGVTRGVGRGHVRARSVHVQKMWPGPRASPRLSAAKCKSAHLAIPPSLAQSSLNPSAVSSETMLSSFPVDCARICT